MKLREMTIVIPKGNHHTPKGVFAVLNGLQNQNTSLTDSYLDPEQELKPHNNGSKSNLAILLNPTITVGISLKWVIKCWVENPFSHK